MCRARAERPTQRARFERKAGCRRVVRRETCFSASSEASSGGRGSEPSRESTVPLSYVISPPDKLSARVLFSDRAEERHRPRRRASSSSTPPAAAASRGKGLCVAMREFSGLTSLEEQKAAVCLLCRRFPGSKSIHEVALVVGASSASAGRGGGGGVAARPPRPTRFSIPSRDPLLDDPLAGSLAT